MLSWRNEKNIMQIAPIISSYSNNYHLRAMIFLVTLPVAATMTVSLRTAAELRQQPAKENLKIYNQRDNLVVHVT